MTDNTHIVDRLDVLVKFKADLDAAQETLSRCERLPLAMVPDQIQEAIRALWRVVHEISDLESYYDQLLRRPK